MANCDNKFYPTYDYTRLFRACHENQVLGGRLGNLIRNLEVLSASNYHIIYHINFSDIPPLE